MTFFLAEELTYQVRVRKSYLRSTSILTNQTILFNWDIINIIQFAKQLCIIEKKLFSLLVDKNNAHQVHKYDVKNQIYLSLSPMFCRRMFPSKLKALKTNVICYVVKQEQPYTQHYLQRVQSVPSLENIYGMDQERPSPMYLRLQAQLQEPWVIYSFSQV